MVEINVGLVIAVVMIFLIVMAIVGFVHGYRETMEREKQQQIEREKNRASVHAQMQRDIDRWESLKGG